MKKSVIILTLAVLFTFGLTACSSSTTKEETPQIKTNGKTLTITLAENPTTGYTLSAAIDKPEIIKATEDSYTQEEGSENKVGAGGTHSFSYEGLKEGTAVITFTEKQDWEGGETAGTQKFTVKVGADGTIESATQDASAK